MPQHGETEQARTPVGELVLVGLHRDALVPRAREWEDKERFGQIFPTVWRDRLGTLFIMYKDRDGSPELTRHRYAGDTLRTTDGRILGMLCAPQNGELYALSLRDGETQTQDRLNTWAAQTEETMAHGDTWYLDVITTVKSRDVLMLSDFASADELWSGYLLPSGRFVVGRYDQLMMVMRECLAAGTLDDAPYAYYSAVCDLVEHYGGDVVPREWRRKALKMFYKCTRHDLTTFWEDTARLNASSWSQQQFGFHPDDVTALPWF